MRLNANLPIIVHNLDTNRQKKVNTVKHFVIFLIALLLGATLPVAAQDNMSAGTLVHDGLERSYLTVLPPGYDAAQPAPLVIVLHGATMDGVSMMLVSEFNESAAAAGHILVYPNGIGGRWNSSAEPDPENNIPDDVGFVNALIDEMAANYAIDLNRVYVTGYSNGGRMAYKLGCQMADRVAAVAVWAATPRFQTAQECVDLNPAPVPYLIIWGTRDSAFPWQGYAVIEEGVLDGAFSASQMMSFLPDLNGCERPSQTDIVAAEDSPVNVIRDSFTTCQNGVEVTLYALIDADHSWPVRPVVLLENGEPGTLREAAWEFFGRHTRGDE